MALGDKIFLTQGKLSRKQIRALSTIVFGKYSFWGTEGLMHGYIL